MEITRLLMEIMVPMITGTYKNLVDLLDKNIDLHNNDLKLTETESEVSFFVVGAVVLGDG